MFIPSRKQDVHVEYALRNQRKHESNFDMKKTEMDDIDREIFGEQDRTASRDGGNATIQVHCRIRPSKQMARQYYTVDDQSGMVEIRSPINKMDFDVNNTKENYDFHFSSVLGEDTKQDTVFDRIAKPICDSVLEGFNGTIFAYGQTGSGKTFTITGGAERYEDRGIIPRTLDYLHKAIAAKTDMQYSMKISYLEIYNESGYDLLSPEHETKKLEELPQVQMREVDGEFIPTNIFALPVSNLEESLNLLFVGDTNRVVCETPSNDASTRSHCIFTILLEGRELAGDRVRRSKLNLVDLAGSERIKKTGVTGKIEREARYINLSLHFLESVIVALHEKSQGKKTHVPYRNSMMTMMLRDSLGGNCKTVMIANMSLQFEHLEESISTGRFAQRVAMIKNQVFVNEIVDPQMVIKRLKMIVREQREQIALLKGDTPQEKPLSEDDIQRLRQLVRDYLEQDPPKVELHAVNVAKLKATFEIFKTMFKNLNANSGTHLTSPNSNNAQVAGPSLSALIGGGDHQTLQEEVKRLKLMLQHRDKEISVLVSMLKSNDVSGGLQGSKAVQVPNLPLQHLNPNVDLSDSTLLEKQKHRLIQMSSQQNTGRALEDDEVALRARAAAFERFRSRYSQNDAIEASKADLNRKYTEAKQLGEAINNARTNIQSLKVLIEQRRMERGIASIAESKDIEATDIEEIKIRSQIDQEKAEYKRNFETLKALKVEIEHMQGMLERSRRKMQQEFEVYWSREQESQHIGSRPNTARALPSTLNGVSAAALSVGIPSPTYKSVSSDSSQNVNLSNNRAPSHTTPRINGSSLALSSSIGTASAPASHSSHSSFSQLSSSVPPMQPSNQRFIPSTSLTSTGNQQADADIAAFYAMKEQLLRKQRQATASRASPTQA